MTRRIGILNLQGCVEPHGEALRRLGAEPVLVNGPRDLEKLHGLILPGGESTTMLKLAQLTGLWPLLAEAAGRLPFWGICAGAILMAKKVENPGQPSLGVMDFTARRNAYGRQLDSFQQTLELEGGERQEAVFIRAPKFLDWGKSVQVLGTLDGEAVFLSEGRHMVTAFHPELTDSPWCHRRFLERL